MPIKCPKCQFSNPDGSQFCGKCAERLPSPEKAFGSLTKTWETPRKELPTGSTFASRYQIIEELGAGGMGKVYRVLDRKLNEEVALKLLRPDIAADRKTLERFSNEVKLARKIIHKNVGRIYHLSDEGGTHFITMEYVHGQDLRSLIRQVRNRKNRQRHPGQGKSSAKNHVAFCPKFKVGSSSPFFRSDNLRWLPDLEELHSAKS